MILLGDKLYPELRSINFITLMSDKQYLMYALRPEPERERFYIITSFKCNCRCQYCLFRFERIKDCTNTILANKVRKVLCAFPQTNFSISITGGEPLLRPKRICAILDAITESTKQQSRIRWIGFGTNGTTPIPLYLQNYPDFKFDLYISRHHYDMAYLQESFHNPNIQPLSVYAELSSNVNVRLSCNLIRGGIDNLVEIKRFLEWAGTNSIKHVTFRELNKVARESSMYNYILNYINYYQRNLIALDSLLPQLEYDSNFEFISQDIRPFIYHEHWRYQGINLTFRHIDEAQLLDYNASFDDIDEVVLHPDGLITGCWDRNQKVLSL